jgi:hypothetical protein
MTRNRTMFLTLTAAIALSLMGTGASAQPREYRDRGRTEFRQPRADMRRLARELEDAARQTALRARQEQSFRRQRDTKFLSELDDFAREATQFRVRLDDGRMASRFVPDGLERLTRDARDVQYRIGRARFADWRTRQEWDRVVSILNVMSSRYRRDGVLADRDYRYSDFGYRNR